MIQFRCLIHFPPVIIVFRMWLRRRMSTRIPIDCCTSAGRSGSHSHSVLSGWTIAGRYQRSMSESLHQCSSNTDSRHLHAAKCRALVPIAIGGLLRAVPVWQLLAVVPLAGTSRTRLREDGASRPRLLRDRRPDDDLPRRRPRSPSLKTHRTSPESSLPFLGQEEE